MKFLLNENKNNKNNTDNIDLDYCDKNKIVIFKKYIYLGYNYISYYCNHLFY